MRPIHTHIRVLHPQKPFETSFHPSQFSLFFSTSEVGIGYPTSSTPSLAKRYLDSRFLTIQTFRKVFLGKQKIFRYSFDLRKTTDTQTDKCFSLEPPYSRWNIRSKTPTLFYVYVKKCIHWIDGGRCNTDESDR